MAGEQRLIPRRNRRLVRRLRRGRAQTLFGGRRAVEDRVRLAHERAGQQLRAVAVRAGGDGGDAVSVRPSLSPTDPSLS